MKKLRKWDIYWAKVAFEDDPDEIKTRPVIITSSGDAYIVALYTTSQSPKPGYPCYVIKHWQNAGLKHPSNIRLDKVLRLRPSDIEAPIGRLAEQDIMFIELEIARLANK